MSKIAVILWLVSPIEYKKPVTMVSLRVYFKKVFDTVKHNILLDKFSHYGVRGIENNWFKTYLTNRKEHVTVNGQISDNALIEFKVPQGSLLGPLPFFLYINDLNQAIKIQYSKPFCRLY